MRACLVVVDDIDVYVLHGNFQFVSGMETTGSEALEQLRLQLQRELFLDVDGELHDAASADAESDYDEFNDGADEEFHQLKFKMEAEKEVSRLN